MLFRSLTQEHRTECEAIAQDVRLKRMPCATAMRMLRAELVKLGYDRLPSVKYLGDALGLGGASK